MATVRGDISVVSSSADVMVRQTRQSDVRAMPNVAPRSRHHTDEHEAVGRQADMMAWQSARGDFVQIAKASSNTVAQCVGSAAW